MRFTARYSGTAITLVCVLLSTSAARAGLLLASDEEQYETVPGGTVSVKLVLSDSDSTDAFDLASEGLFGGGGRILNTGGAAIISVLDIAPGPGFDAVIQSFPSSRPFPEVDSRNFAGILASAPFRTTSGIGLGKNAITIGTFEIMVEGIVGDQAFLTTAQLDSDARFQENVSFGTATILDPLITSFGASTITVVPEPTGICILALSCMVGMQWINKLRKVGGRNSS